MVIFPRHQNGMINRTHRTRNRSLARGKRKPTCLDTCTSLLPCAFFEEDWNGKGSTNFISSFSKRWLASTSMDPHVRSYPVLLHPSHPMFLIFFSYVSVVLAIYSGVFISLWMSCLLHHCCCFANWFRIPFQTKVDPQKRRSKMKTK